MPKLYSSAFIAKILLHHNFFLVSQKGSHMKFRKEEDTGVLTVILPANQREIPFGTFRSIVRQSGLSSEDFER